MTPIEKGEGDKGCNSISADMRLKSINKCEMSAARTTLSSQASFMDKSGESKSTNPSEPPSARSVVRTQARGDVPGLRGPGRAAKSSANQILRLWTAKKSEQQQNHGDMDSIDQTCIDSYGRKSERIHAYSMAMSYRGSCHNYYDGTISTGEIHNGEFQYDDCGSGSGSIAKENNTPSCKLYIIPVGQRLRIWWHEDSKWYGAQIHSILRHTEFIKHRILYDDGDFELLDLTNEVFELINEDDESEDDGSSNFMRENIRNKKTFRRCEFCNKSELDCKRKFLRGPNGMGTLCPTCGGKWYRKNYRPGFKKLESDGEDVKGSGNIRSTNQHIAASERANKRKIMEAILEITRKGSNIKVVDAGLLCDEYLQRLSDAYKALDKDAKSSDSNINPVTLSTTFCDSRDSGFQQRQNNNVQEERLCSRCRPAVIDRVDKASRQYFVAPKFDFFRDVKLDEFLKVADEGCSLKKKWQPGIKWQQSSSVLVMRSSFIQGIGVFSSGFIPEGVVVLNYTGEEIRPTVADVRESRQLKRQRMFNNNEGFKTGSDSMYMFRRRDDVIVDASNSGNIARFVNHSCAPNCEAKDTVNLHGKRRIVFKSIRNILPGEELSYDYKMAIEHPRDWIKCSCGAKSCRKYLNG